MGKDGLPVILNPEPVSSPPRGLEEAAKAASGGGGRRRVHVAVQAARGPPEVVLSVTGFFLSALWEFAQLPLYTDHPRGFGYVVWTRFHCTLGDVLILLAAFWIIAVIFRTRRWYARESLWRTAAFTGLGLAYTAWSEWFNTTVRGSWSYAEAMPTVFGLGVAPLFQWLLLPPALVWILRKVACRPDSIPCVWRAVESHRRENKQAV